MSEFFLKCVGVWFVITGLVTGVSGQTFTNIAPAAGISGGYGTPQFEGGGGLSFVDFNLDGFDDLTFCTGAGADLQFYVNSGNDTFSLVNPPYVSHTGEARQAVWVDYDRDGDKDLFVTAYNAPNRLYQNTGGMNFTEVTASAGLPLLNEYTYGANFGDLDLDGDLDLYISNYGPPWDGQENDLYLNNGDGTFTEVTDSVTSNGIKQTFCTTFFDYNLDGHPDIYVVNDRHIWPNALLEGTGDGMFIDMSDSSGSDVADLAMNGGIADYNGDGYPDIYVTTSYTSFMLESQGDGTYLDVAGPAGVAFDRFGWGGNFFDYDNDTDLDLYVCCMIDAYNTPNAFYTQTTPGVFTEPFRWTGGLAGIDTARSYSNAIGDFNNDGWEDIALSNATTHDFYLWENENAAGSSNKWVKVRLQGTRSNPEAIGTRLVFWVGGTPLTRYTHVANAYLAQNSNTITVGLGTASFVDSIEIFWPFPCGSMPYTKQVIPQSEIHLLNVNVYTEGCSCPDRITHTVTSNANSGPGTLRQFLSQACPGDTIKFDASLQFDTIALSGSTLDLTKDIVIEGFAQPDIVLRLTDQTSALEIPDGVEIRLSGIEVLDGTGSGIDPLLTNAGVLMLSNVQLTAPAAVGSRLIESSGTLVQEGVTELRRE